MFNVRQQHRYERENGLYSRMDEKRTDGVILGGLGMTNKISNYNSST